MNKVSKMKKITIIVDKKVSSPFYFECHPVVFFRTNFQLFMICATVYTVFFLQYSKTYSGNRI